MKALFKAAITTGVLTTGMAIAMPANALTFNFSYKFTSGDELSGVLEGEQNGDVVTVLGVSSSFMNGMDLGAKQVSSFTSTAPGSGRVSFDGSVFDLFVSNPLGAYSDQTGFGFRKTTTAIRMVYGFNGETSPPDLRDTFELSRWSLTSPPAPSTTAPTNTVPTPAAILPVLAGLFGAAFKRKQEES